MNNNSIFIVEDESIVATNIKKRLSASGYTISGVAVSGEDALDLIPKKKPDLILMDIKLKGEMDGIDVAERISENLNIPIIYLTAYADDDRVERAKYTMPFGYIMKPFEDKELDTTIKIALHKHKVYQELSESNKWFKKILQNIDNGVIVTDEDGLVSFMNSMAEKMTGIPVNTATGKSLDQIFKIECNLDNRPNKQTVDLIMKLLREKEGIRLYKNTSLIVREDERIPIELNIGLLENRHRVIQGILLVFHDATERQLNDEMILNQINELREILTKEGKLYGILPVCSFCKRVSPRENEWINIEKYIQDNTELKVHHTLCSVCANRIYSEPPQNDNPESELI